MANHVETVLKEIRERVIAKSNALTSASGQQSDVVVGNNHGQSAPSTRNGALDRLSAQLAITARAWDRLPPVISNRRGSLNRIEVATKKLFKPLTRWFTWEQVNFNAAVHHALLETLALLRAQDQELITLRSMIANQKLADELQAVHTRLVAVDAILRRYSEMLSELAAEMRQGNADLTKELQKRFPEMANDLESALKKLAEDFDIRLAEISADLREEQRVCFRQLSLETSEAAVLEDRGRRALESRVARLESSVPDSK